MTAPAKVPVVVEPDRCQVCNATGPLLEVTGYRISHVCHQCWHMYFGGSS